MHSISKLTIMTSQASTNFNFTMTLASMLKLLIKRTTCTTFTYKLICRVSSKPNVNQRIRQIFSLSSPMKSNPTKNKPIRRLLKTCRRLLQSSLDLATETVRESFFRSSNNGVKFCRYSKLWRLSTPSRWITNLNLIYQALQISNTTTTTTPSSHSRLKDSENPLLATGALNLPL